MRQGRKEVVSRVNKPVFFRLQESGIRQFFYSDQIEAGTFMFAVAAAGGNVLVKNVIPKHLEATTAKLLEVGCQVEEFDDSVRVISDGHLKHTQVTTLPYPGFPTDMQPQMAVLLGIAEGTSTVTESIFENRFKHSRNFIYFVHCIDSNRFPAFDCWKNACIRGCVYSIWNSRNWWIWCKK